MTDEKTIAECAADGCSTCAYLMGYTREGLAVAKCFPSELLAGIQLARSPLGCKQFPVIKTNFDNRMRSAR